MPDFQTLSTVIIFAGFIITAAFIVLVPDWRLALFALVVQYLVAAALLIGLVPFQIAMVRLASGALAILILYLTLRQKAERAKQALQQAQDAESFAAAERLYWREVFVVGFPFRLFALALIAVGIVGIASSIDFLDLPVDVLFSGMWLITSGILVAILSRDVLRLGLGILMFTNGFSILEMTTEESLLLFGLLVISDLLIALVVAHLGAMPAYSTEQHRRHGESE